MRRVLPAARRWIACGSACLAPLGAFAAAACVPSYDFGPTPGGDGGADASDAAPPPLDAAAPVDGHAVDLSIIYCNQGGTPIRCPIATQGCCAVFAGISDFCVDLANADASCTSPDAAVALVQCDEPDQCSGGQVCCAVGLTFDGTGAHYTAVQCMDPASCAAASGGIECGNPHAGMIQSACQGTQVCTDFPDHFYFCQ
jgi:hypothetical protein